MLYSVSILLRGLECVSAYLQPTILSKGSNTLPIVQSDKSLQTADNHLLFEHESSNLWIVLEGCMCGGATLY